MVRDIFSTCFHPRQPLPLDLERSVSDKLSFLLSFCTHLFSSDCGYQAAEHEPSPRPFAKQLIHYRWRVQWRWRPQGAHQWAALIICSFTGRRRGKSRSTSADGAEGNCAATGATAFGTANLQVSHSGDFQRPFAPSPCFHNILRLLLAAR